MIEEKNATMAEATTVQEESPVLDETPVQTENQAPDETPVLEETSADSETPPQVEAPVLEEASVQTENQEQDETPADSETPPQVEAPVLEEASVQTENQEQDEAPADSETPPQVEAPVLEEAPVAATASEEQAQSESASESTEEGKPVVRMLSVGQEVTGVVKRVSDFGAFVDIGVGRDGLVHISELSARRVAKVTDVLQQGQEATFWIKKLDRDRNRISLTMIEPGTKTIRNMDKGDIVQGTVTRIMPYGAFVDIGIGRDALLHVREMGERFVAKPEDVVQVGDSIDARILDISRRRARVDLSIKGLRPEPEPEPAPEPEKTAATEPEPEQEPADPFEDMEVLSPIEAALRKAMQESGTKLNLRKDTDRRSKKHESARARAMQEEILERTLNSSGKK